MTSAIVKVSVFAMGVVGASVLATQPASALPSLDRGVAKAQEQSAGVEKVWGYRRWGGYGYGWRRPWGGYGYGWRRPWGGYGYGWRRPWRGYGYGYGWRRPYWGGYGWGGYGGGYPYYW